MDQMEWAERWPPPDHGIVALQDYIKSSSIIHGVSENRIWIVWKFNNLQWFKMSILVIKLGHKRKLIQKSNTLLLSSLVYDFTLLCSNPWPCTE